MATQQNRKGAQAPRVDFDIAEEEEYYVTRPKTSVRRYRQPAQQDTVEDYAPTQAGLIQRRRAGSGAPANTEDDVRINSGPITLARPRRRRSPWPAVIIGMALMIGLVVCFSALTSWWQVHQDDVTYGRPRTYQVNAVVGHHDSASNPSHFIFMNLNRHVIIIEIPGGDATHTLSYTGPTLFGDGGDLIPVTGVFKDVNGDGRPDMLVHIQDQTIIYINDGTKFRPLQPGEHVNV